MNIPRRVAVCGARVSLVLGNTTFLQWPSFLSVALTLVLILPLSTIQSSATQQAVVARTQRGGQALGVITSPLNATGGLSALYEIQPPIGIETISYYSSGRDVRGEVAAKGLGPATFPGSYQNSSTDNPQPTRDTQALEILNQTISAAGGAASLSAVQDFSASGTITYYWDSPVSGNATVQGRGPGQFRIDATLQDGIRTVIANNGTGSVTGTDGSVTVIPYAAAINLGSMTFPYSSLVAAVQTSSFKITYVGLVDHQGSQLHDVRVQKTYPSNDDPTGSQSALSVRDYLIDPNSFLIVSVLNIVDQGTDGNSISREVVFANYQTVNGLAVPFQITEKIHDQTMVLLQLTQINFNTGLTDASFTK